jgi:hypothetical protein
MERISPRVDIAFKKIFGVEENKDLLISLINSIIGEEDQVEEITAQKNLCKAMQLPMDTSGEQQF